MNKALRKLLVLVLAIVVSASAIVGGTYAWFTDTVTSARNTIQSGNLDMKVYYKPYGAENTTWDEVTKDTKVFKENALYEPGYTEAVWLKIENNGNLAFRSQTALNILTETQGTNQAGEKFKLSDFLVVKAATVTDVEGWESFYTTRASLNSFAFGSAANSFEKGLNSKDLTINTNGVAYPKNDPVYSEYSTTYVLVILEMPTTVGNEANHDGTNVPSIEFGLNVLATQLVHEEDSFGKDYDEDALYPVHNENELMEAFKGGKSVKLNNDIVLSRYAIANGGGITAVIDLNDKTIKVESSEDAKNKNTAFVAQNGAKVIVNGDGTLKMDYSDEEKEDYCMPFLANKSGVVEINGGTYKMGACEKNYHLFSQNSGKIIINDGTFITSNPNAAIAYCINGFVEINGGFFQNTADKNEPLLSMGNNLNYINNQKITLSGGTFVNWNPMDSAFAKPWTNPDVPALIVLADGYKVVSETQVNGDVWYTVVKA